MEPKRACTRWGVAAVAATFSLALGAGPTAAHPPAPGSPSQPAHDGCQRSDFGIGFGTSPQWVYVYRSPRIRKAAGVTRVSHMTVDDSQLQHSWYDFNANLVLGRRYRYLLGGSRSQRTSNFAGDDEETRRVHYEWESGTFPFFAWPTDGDRTTVWGSWIWDCGHWTNVENNTGNAKITGEHTELHPFNAIVVFRRSPYRHKRVVRQADVFVSNQGTKAHAVEKCALSHHPQQGGPFPQYDSGYKPCYQNRANWIQPLKRRYRFFLRAPRRPRGATRLRFRVVNRIKGGSGRQRVRVRRHGISVSVGLPSSSHPVRYGKSFVVWWAGRQRHRPTPLKVRLKSIFIRHSDPDPIYGAQTSPWELWVDVNGYWNRLNRWLPQLGAVHDGQRIPINRTIKIYVPRRHRVWVQLNGFECDEPGGTVVLGIFANVVHPCPANTTEINPNPFLLLMNDSVGTVVNVFRSARASLGRHVSTSHGRVRFPGTGRISLGHGNQGDQAFTLTYVVRRARR
jgi:hypothetical protein